MVNTMRTCLPVLMVVVVAAASSSTSARAQQALEARDYAVYSALLDHLYQSDRGELVIAQEVGAAQHVYARSQLVRGLPADLRADLKRKINAPARLEGKLDIKSPYVLVSRAGCPTPRGASRRSATKCAALGRAVGLSRVAFDDEGAEALVYVVVNCEGLCGSSTFYLLKREQGRWHVVRVKGVSES